MTFFFFPTKLESCSGYSAKSPGLMSVVCVEVPDAVYGDGGVLFSLPLVQLAFATVWLRVGLWLDRPGQRTHSHQDVHSVLHKELQVYWVIQGDSPCLYSSDA